MNWRDGLKIAMTGLVLATGGVTGFGADPESDPPLFSFGVIADPQYCDAPDAGARHYRKSLDKLEEAVAFFNRRPVEFVVVLGDTIDRDSAGFDAPMARLQQLNALCFMVLGNHDFAVADTEKANVPAYLGMKARYYEFTVRNWRFLVLDSMDVSLGAYLSDSDSYRAAEAMFDDLKTEGAPNAFEWNGAIGKEQMAWLQARLDDARSNGQRVVIFSHIPAAPGLGASLWNDAEVVELLSRYGSTVAAYCAGHHHPGGFLRQQGVPILIFRGMVEGEPNAYAEVSVYPDKLVVHGYGDEKSREIPVGGQD